jgi:FtsP/CotA-like multicopper oxidase with cupredoxin domain
MALGPKYKLLPGAAGSLIAFVLSLTCSSNALCQSESRPFKEPPEGPQSVNGELELNLTVGYSYIPIFNPVNSVNNLLRVRTYNGALVGPTIRVRPGERLKVNLTNALPADPVGAEPANMNVPHDFNVTNLHTHGLHVSPQGNAMTSFCRLCPGRVLPILSKYRKVIRQAPSGIMRIGMGRLRCKSQVEWRVPLS